MFNDQPSEINKHYHYGLTIYNSTFSQFLHLHKIWKVASCSLLFPHQLSNFSSLLKRHAEEEHLLCSLEEAVMRREMSKPCKKAEPSIIRTTGLYSHDKQAAWSKTSKLAKEGRREKALRGYNSLTIISLFHSFLKTEWPNFTTFL